MCLVAKFQLLVLCMFIVLEESHQLITPNRIDKNCDPSIDKKMTGCPSGYCCVRDEFLATYIYCKKIGGLNGHCTMRKSESACPCGPGLHCKPNIQSSTIQSLYGKCVHTS